VLGGDLYFFHKKIFFVFKKRKLLKKPNLITGNQS